MQTKSWPSVTLINLLWNSFCTCIPDAANAAALSNFAVGVARRNEFHRKSRLDFETLPASIFSLIFTQIVSPREVIFLTYPRGVSSPPKKYSFLDFQLHWYSYFLNNFGISWTYHKLYLMRTQLVVNHAIAATLLQLNAFRGFEQDIHNI